MRPAPTCHRSSTKRGFRATVWRHLNFFRVHLLFFTFTPLILSTIMYASNGRYPIPYIDALFNSVSAITVCGLATVNLSPLTPWQQVILFIQMFVGSPVVISWFMVYIRRYFFAKKFDHILRAEATRYNDTPEAPKPRSPDLASTTSGRHGLTWRMTSLLRRRGGLSPVLEEYSSEDEVGAHKDKDKDKDKEKDTHKKLRPEMIRRMDAPPKRVNPSGWISEGIVTPLKRFSTRIGTGGGLEDGQVSENPVSLVSREPPPTLVSSPIDEKDEMGAAKEGEGAQMQPSGEDKPPPSVSEGTRSEPAGLCILSSSTLQNGPPSVSNPSSGIARTTTIEFAPTVTRHYIPLTAVQSRSGDETQDSMYSEPQRRPISQNNSDSRRYPSLRGPQIPLTRNSTQHTSRSAVDQVELRPSPSSPGDFGGFPMPHEMLGMLFGRLFPGTANRLQRTLTVPETTVLTGGELGRTASISGAGQRAAAASIPEGYTPVPYISFDAIVGRNSAFQMLTNEHLEELGGIEYRALNALLWLIVLYHFGTQLVSFAVIAPYMAMPKWASDFVPPALTRPVATPWFSLFQVVSTYSNTGFSLVDQSMLPFQTAYPMILFMVFLIVAGNTAFPILFRFMIWVISKLVPSRSRLYVTLRFLLDHPRRCFVYLFPPHQTWFLLLVVVLLNSINFFCFLVLDIGIPAIDSIPFGTRFVIGLLQTTDVRASGFAIVPVASLAPAVKVMFIVMMYISVYPIAMSVRSTNVYEERSLGIFRDEDQLSAAEQAFQGDGSRRAMWGRYLAMHARYQLSFDMWWLALALFLICIIERDRLINPEMESWFNEFTIFFEIVSAYGSVGLSVGIPDQNYSLSGAFRPLSKLIICLVMIRGRHRGLPVAIDRAIVLPYEFRKDDDDDDPDSEEEDGEQQSALHGTGTGNVSHPVDGVRVAAKEDDSHGQADEEKDVEAQLNGEKDGKVSNSAL